ncbi:Transmembrane emp24 domain-containing protein eca [Eufriesea mexicana]|uniref:Transmembrane emp24 domain-containing protein eca n=1 Tax=Eufriesea mexicana TaxID=516756 RepID=A0A310SHA8_9HYME|nr:Transmembrane emp24 domain-containing protein eca [Eufriesea mexicana]
MDNARPPWRLANCLRFVTAGLTATGDTVKRGKTIEQNDGRVCSIGKDDLGDRKSFRELNTPGKFVSCQVCALCPLIKFKSPDASFGSSRGGDIGWRMSRFGLGLGADIRWVWVWVLIFGRFGLGSGGGWVGLFEDPGFGIRVGYLGFGLGSGGGWVGLFEDPGFGIRVGYLGVAKKGAARPENFREKPKQPETNTSSLSLVSFPKVVLWQTIPITRSHHVEVATYRDPDMRPSGAAYWRYLYQRLTRGPRIVPESVKLLVSTGGPSWAVAGQDRHFASQPHGVELNHPCGLTVDGTSPSASMCPSPSRVRLRQRTAQSRSEDALIRGGHPGTRCMTRLTVTGNECRRRVVRMTYVARSCRVHGKLCSLTLTRLVILRPLGSDLTSISIAVKMQSSKRTLRSNEMAIPTGGMLDTELELQFALQYPHFLKRDGNKLLIQLQRRKRYKNRTMLGYKTLAEGVINMAQVLQKQMDLELELVSDKAEKYGGHSVALARVSVVALSSQPVDQDKRLMNDPNERLCPEYSDEEEEFSSEGEAEGSDSEPTLEMHRRKSRAKIPANARQRNLKQKFIALLKRRFRVSEDLDQDQEEIGQKLSESLTGFVKGAEMEIDELFDELENLSDSGPELDTMSVSSTPKPSLRPFFSSSRSLLAPPHSVVTNEETGSTPATAIGQQSTGQPAKEKHRIGHTTPGLYFHIAETERKCFIDEIPDETTVLVNYKVELYDPRTGGFAQTRPGMGMHVEVRDPDDKMILSRVYSSEGRFSFTSHTPGEHVICLYSNSSSWFSGTQLRVHLDIHVSDHSIDYSNTAHKEKFTQLQLRLRQLLDQVEQITKEQNYQRYREERFRQTSESTNRRVFWWSLAQSVILLFMGAWQMRHLKSFFEAKKLV